MAVYSPPSLATSLLTSWQPSPLKPLPYPSHLRARLRFTPKATPSDRHVESERNSPAPLRSVLRPFRSQQQAQVTGTASPKERSLGIDVLCPSVELLALDSFFPKGTKAGSGQTAGAGGP